MIPQRVKLSGFLSYKDEQEIRFDGSPLWMLSGTNGSGKSSIFDAVTFALFGHHRGGSQSAVELINKESNTLSVEFDFTVEGHLYRIKRTVRRRTNSVASTQQVLKQSPGTTLWSAGVPPASSSSPEKSGQDGRAPQNQAEWDPIPDTQLRARFDAWVKDKIGLDYETFTSSVLLLQGKSEKLLDSTPSGRAGVLARIVDLERYQKLHGRADDRRRELKGKLEGISNQLAGLREVTDEEYAAVATRIDTARETRDTHEKRHGELQGLELQARNWANVQGNLAAAKQKLTTAEGLLGTAMSIEKDCARLRELRDVLPAVGTIVTERGRIAESERKTERLTKEREAKADVRRQTDHALDQSRKKLASLKKTLTEDEARQTALNERLRALTGILEKVKQVEAAAAEVEYHTTELKALPADPEAAVRQFQQEQERLALLAQHVGLLERLDRDRSELMRATAAEVQAKKDEARLIAEGKKAKDDFTALEAKAKAAREDRAAKDQAAAESRALAKQARDLADEFKQLGGAKTCRACGQELTPQHLEAERKKRDLDATAAGRKADALAAAAEVARKLEQELSQQESADRDHLGKLREDWKEAAGEVKRTAQDIKRLTDSCQQSYFALPDEFKSRVSPTDPPVWAKVTFPERHDITALNGEAKQLDGVRRKFRTAQDEAAKAQALRAKLESARDRHTKAKQGLPAGDSVTLRQEYADKQSADSAVVNQIKATKAEIAGTERDIDRQQRELGNVDLDLTDITGKLNLEDASRRQSAEAVERAKKVLPPAWQKPAETAGLTDRARWQDELDALVSNDTEGKFTKLQAARGGLDSLRAEITQLEQEADVFPEEARRSPDEVKALVAAARKDVDAANKELLDAEGQKRLLDQFRAQRAEFNDRYKATDADHTRAKTLAELLGRDRLQRHLVRQAERQIVDYGNAVLDRLSGGQLFLKLVEADAGTDKALDLECYNRVTGGAPINVAFLSGSQRFRVAVALALGIGQYASKQHRPIESVIIDEGFGCLDRAGRQVMIQELQNLRGHLHCILLVSHQEEFAEAFPDGYRFELHDGATKVSRFAR